MSECECHMCRFGFIRFDAPVAQPHEISHSGLVAACFEGLKVFKAFVDRKLRERLQCTTRQNQSGYRAKRHFSPLGRAF